MKKVLRLGSILIMAMMIAAPSMSFAMEEKSFDASGNDTQVTEPDTETGGTGLTEVTVAESVTEFAEESEASHDNEAFFTIDAAKDDSAELATDEVTEAVTEILSGGGSDSEKQSEVAEALEDSGFYSAEESGESRVDVTSKFSGQRLRLIAPHQEELNAHGAVKAVYFEDSYYLSYDSMEATMQAYDALVSEYGGDSVFIDSPVKARAGEKGWGTAFMRLDHQKVLADNSGQVTVAVVDTGIQRSHPVFSGTTILDGYDFVNKDNDPADDEGHGTAVSGVIAESTPSSVRILPLKALDEKGEGSEFDVIAAIRYAEEQGADIINLSLGGEADPAEAEEYDREFSGYDSLIVCAAGNDRRNLDAPGADEFPAELSSVVCVNAITSGKAKWYGSNYGKAVDFTAPGSNIMVAKRGGTYFAASGTSFSAPYIAAAAATVKAGHEDYSNEQIIGYLEGTAEDLGTPGRDVYYGAGCPRFAPKKITPAVKLSKTAFTWNNNAQMPSVTVYDGEQELPSEQYRLTYSSGRKNVGEYSVKVTLKDNYSGTKTVTYRICPKGTRITKLAGAKKALTVTWAKQSAKMSTSVISGYQVQTSTDAKFEKNKKTVTVRGYTKTSGKVSGLAAGRKYYVRVRAYKTVKEKNYYSGWSPVKAVRTR